MVTIMEAGVVVGVREELKMTFDLCPCVCVPLCDRIFTAIMPMVAAGLIPDDPTLQPIRRLMSLV